MCNFNESRGKWIMFICRERNFSIYILTEKKLPYFHHNSPRKSSHCHLCVGPFTTCPFTTRLCFFYVCQCVCWFIDICKTIDQ
jgi:hypothetical protein